MELDYLEKTMDARDFHSVGGAVRTGLSFRPSASVSAGNRLSSRGRISSFHTRSTISSWVRTEYADTAPPKISTKRSSVVIRSGIRHGLVEDGSLAIELFS